MTANNNSSRATPAQVEEIERAILRQGSAYAKVKQHCPVCDPYQQRSKSLSVDMVSLSFKCFRDTCAVWGRLGDYRLYGVRVTPNRAEGQPRHFVSWDEVPHDAEFEGFFSFLRENGITDRVASALRVGACLEGPLFGRVIFPLIDQWGEWCGWIGRLWDVGRDQKAPKGGQKYLAASNFKRGTTLYNRQVLANPSDSPVYVVEGVLDVVHLGVEDSVASLGDLTSEQEAILATSKRPVVFVPDGDAWTKGLSAALRLRMMGARSGIVRLPPKLDPNHVDRMWVREVGLLSLEQESTNLLTWSPHAPPSLTEAQASPLPSTSL